MSPCRTTLYFSLSRFSTAIFITAALVLNAMAPALAHAATQLQGDQVNANALVRDAYIAITYRDRNDQKRMARGWIDALGETSFTIRSGGLKGKTTIAYVKVLSIIMSTESSVPAKQMNEVNRFIRNEQMKAVSVAVMTRGQVIAGVDRFVGERARQVVVAKGRYVGVTYRKDDGKIETVEGFVRERDETELTIRRGLWRKKIPLNGIDVLIVCDHPSQLQRATRVIATREREKDQSIGVRIVSKSLVGALAGIGGTGVGGIVGSIVGGRGIEVGMGIGYAVGVPIGVSLVDPHDRFSMTMAGGLLASGAGFYFGTSTDWPISVLLFPILGAMMMSEVSRTPLNTRRFSVGLAPDRSGNVSAIATLRF